MSVGRENTLSGPQDTSGQKGEASPDLKQKNKVQVQYWLRT